jgi:pyruvate kinase
MEHHKTKIMATVGPVTLDFDVFGEMIGAGVDFLRINTSYGDYDQYDKILANLHRPEIQRKVQVVFDIKKLETLDYFMANHLDIVAVSFTESIEYVQKVREKIGGAFLVSKIESQGGVNNFDAILEVSDGIMVARGDLSRSQSLEKVPPLQKEFAQKTLAKNKFLITATEMLLSMKENTVPTNAEVSDVANAVFDGSTAVMLSEETAIGKHPIESVPYMYKIIEEAEKWKYRSDK